MPIVHHALRTLAALSVRQSLRQERLAEAQQLSIHNEVDARL